MTDWNDSRATDELRRVMRVAVPVEAPEEVQERRGRLVQLIEQEIALVPLRAASSERRKRWWRVGLSAAALLLLGGTSSYWIHSVGMYEPRNTSLDAGSMEMGTVPAQEIDAASMERGRADSGAAALSVEPRQASAAGQQANALVVGSTLALEGVQTARVKLPGGTRMHLSQQGKLRLVEADPFSQQVHLDAGRLEVDVEEGQSRARRVRVTTVDARVEVKGTLFIVEVINALSGMPVTRVSVERGEVLVYSQGEPATLGPGQTWSSGEGVLRSAPISIQMDASSAGRSRAAQPQAPTGARAPARRAVSSGSSDSTLAAQNALLERAVRLEQRGQLAGADEVLLQLLSKYPDSPLRSTVHAERKRLRFKRHADETK